MGEFVAQRQRTSVERCGRSNLEFCAERRWRNNGRHLAIARQNQWARRHLFPAASGSPRHSEMAPGRGSVIRFQRAARRSACSTTFKRLSLAIPTGRNVEFALFLDRRSPNQRHWKAFGSTHANTGAASNAKSNFEWRCHGSSRFSENQRPYSRGGECVNRRAVRCANSSRARFQSDVSRRHRHARAALGSPRRGRTRGHQRFERAHFQLRASGRLSRARARN